MKVFNTSYSKFLKRALNMHTSQNQAISENIENVNTQGYIKKDTDFSKLSGLDEMIVQEMFSTGFLVRLLSNWVPQPALRSKKNRFAATNHIDESVTNTGKFIEIFVVDREKLVCLELQPYTPRAKTIVAVAVVALD